MRRVLSIVILALMVLVLPTFGTDAKALYAQEGETVLDVQPVSADSSVSAASDAGSPSTSNTEADAFQSRIVVRSQKRKREFNDKIVVIQRKPFIRRGRVELAPYFHGTVNDSLLFQIGASGQLNYHVLEWLYVGIYGGWHDWRFIDKKSSGLSSSYNEVVDAIEAIPATSIVDGFIGGVVGFVPVYGKFSIFNSAVVHWDLSFGIGGGTVITRANRFVGAGLVTVDHRWYLRKWLSLNFAVKGWIYYENIQIKKAVFTNWQAGIGVGFWLPPSWTYSSEW